MTAKRKAELCGRIRALDADTIGALFPMPDLPKALAKSEFGRAFTRVCRNLGEAIAIAREALDP